MAARKLQNILRPHEEEGLRWRVAVPVGTNPLILTEFLQLSCVSCLIILLSCTLGLYLTEGGVFPEDIAVLLRFAVIFFAVVFALFLLLAFVLLKNRYYAVYRLDQSGIYYELIRGCDESGASALRRMRPYPVQGIIKASRTYSRHLIWEKVTSFQNIHSMRAVVLRRKIWHMLKLYSPDEAAHAALLEYLCTRFSADDALPS